MNKKILASFLAAGFMLTSGCSEKLPERAGESASAAQQTSCDTSKIGNVPAEDSAPQSGIEFERNTEALTSGYRKFNFDLTKLSPDSSIKYIDFYDYDPSTSTALAILSCDDVQIPTSCELVNLETYERTPLFELASNVVYSMLIDSSDSYIVYIEGFDTEYDFSQSKTVLFNRTTGEKTVLMPFGTDEDDGQYNGIASRAVIDGDRICCEIYEYDDIADSYSNRIDVYNAATGESETIAPNSIFPVKYRDTFAYISFAEQRFITESGNYSEDENLTELNSNGLYINQLSCDDDVFVGTANDYGTGTSNTICVNGGEIKEIFKSGAASSYISEFITSGGKACINCSCSEKPFYYDIDKDTIYTLDNEDAAYFFCRTYDEGIMMYTSEGSILTVIVI